MMNCRFSVVMPVHNGRRYLSEAVESILDQSFEEFEFIIIDDASSDDSFDLLTDFSSKDKRISLYKNSANLGFAETLNKGFGLASGDWVFRMDQDDISSQDRFEKQIAFIHENPDVKVSSCRARYINEHDMLFGVTSNHLRQRSDWERYRSEGETIGLLHPGAVLHRQTILSAGGYRKQFWPAEDIDLWMRLTERGHLILIQDEILFRYRIHTDSEITAKFINSRLQYEWVRQCAVARRAGLDEPDRVRFESDWKARGAIFQMNWKRKTLAKFYYRKAGQYFLAKKFLQGICLSALAGLLQPWYVFKRVINQMV